MRWPSGMARSSWWRWQIRSYLGFLWASSGLVQDYVAHNVDECCWMKESWPVKAQGSGGRCHRGNGVDQNFDHYDVEYTFADGAKLFLYARNIPGCHGEFAPDVDKLTMDSPAPVLAKADGSYPTPQPGVLKDREY